MRQEWKVAFAVERDLPHRAGSWDMLVFISSGRREFEISMESIIEQAIGEW